MCQDPGCVKCWPPLKVIPRSAHADSKSQPAPTGDGKIVVDAVMRDLEQRSVDGEKKYGTKLKTFNGRNPLIDAYQEALDLVMYLKQAIMEQERELPPTN
jgi:hypothetical protein